MQSIFNFKKNLTLQKIFKKDDLSTILILLVITIILIILVVYMLQESAQESAAVKTEEISIKKLDSEKYWAVFLTNEQVYFGHLKNLGSDYPQLTDVYYFILRKPLQGQLEEEMAKLEPSLIKLGNEIHGPVDSMIINKDHILFVEQLKDDSKVVKAIKEHKRAMKY